MVSMAEVWKPIPGERGYEASSEGRIRSVPRALRDGRHAGGAFLAQQDDKDGYPTVKIRGRRVRVNVLVQLAFAGPPEVRHLDGDRHNCTPPNLEYGSRWRNERDKKEQEDRKERGGYRPSPVVTKPVTGGRGGL